MADDFDKSSKLDIDSWVLEHSRFLKSAIDRIAVRIGNEYNTPLFIHRKESDINYTDLIQFANNAGFLAGENFQLVEYSVGFNGYPVITFTLMDLSQFQLVFKVNAPDNFSVEKRAAEFRLLMENGDFAKAENNNFLKIQGLVP